MGLFNFFTQEIAIDLGTANTLIIHNEEVVVNEPSIVALDRNNLKTVLAVGKRALMMHEKTHESIRTIQTDRLIALRERRNNEQVQHCLKEIKEAAQGTANLMSLVIAAVEQWCTLGEISDVLREVFGEYKQR